MSPFSNIESPEATKNQEEQKSRTKLSSEVPIPEVLDKIPAKLQSPIQMIDSQRFQSEEEKLGGLRIDKDGLIKL